MIKNEIRFIYRPEIVNQSNQSMGGGSGIGGGTGIGEGGGQQSFMNYGTGWSGNTTYLMDVPSSTVQGNTDQVLMVSGWTFDTLENNNAGWMRSDVGSTEPIWMNLQPVSDPMFDEGYYTVTIDVKGLQEPTPLNVGDTAEGGVVFYTWNKGTEGLVYADHDYDSTGVTWGCNGTLIGCTGDTSLVPGLGKIYTDLITSVCTGWTSASWVKSLNISGYTDWYLPSLYEFSEVCANKDDTFWTGTTNDRYQTSTESSELLYFRVNGKDCSEQASVKTSTVGTGTYHIRPIRQFNLNTESITPVLYGITGLPITTNGRFSQQIYVTGTTTIQTQQLQVIPTAGFTGGFSNISIIPSMGTTKRLDLYDEDTFVLNFQITTDFSGRASNYSKTIKVPGTPNNNQIFKMLFDENLFIGNTTGDTVIFLNKRIPAGIYQDTIQLMVGYFELEKVIKGEYFIEYEGTFYGNVKSLADSIGDKMLSGNDNPLDDLDFSEWDHLYTIPNVIASYNNTTMYNNSVGYFYPFIDYQGFEDGTKLDFTCVRPAIYVKELWDKIFADAGYQYSSNFLNSTEFKSLVIPLTKNVSEDTFELDKNKFQIGVSSNMSGDTAGTSAGTFAHGSSMTGWTYWSGYDIAGYSGGILPAVQAPCSNSSSYVFKCGLHNFYSYSDGRTRGVKLPFDQMSGCLVDYSGNTVSLFNNTGSTGLSWDTTNKWWNVRRSGNYKLHAFISYDLFGKPYDSSNSPFFGAWTSGDEYGQYNTVEVGLHCYRVTPSGMHENIGETVETVYINNPHVGNFGDPNPNAFAVNAGTKGEDWILNNQVISLDISEQDLYVTDKVYFYMTIRAGSEEFKWRSVGTPMTGGWVQTWVMVNKILSYCNNDYNNKPYLYEGNMVHMNNILPDMKQIDFVKGISNMYNLIYQEDKDVPGNIIIEPWNDFFRSGITETTDWTYKVDGKGEEIIDRIPDLVNKDVLFQYVKDGNDDLTKKYSEEYTVPYGSMTITNPYLSEGNMKVDSLFSTCFIKNFGTSSWLMSSLWNEGKRKTWLTDNKKSDQTFSTKIMYRKKLIPSDLGGQTLSKISVLSYLSGTTSGTTSGANWYRLGEFYFGGGTTRNFFPYAGHWDNPYNPTKDLNWGVQKYYFSKLHKYTLFNLFKNYWKEKIALYMDPNSKLVTYTMRLNHSDIAMLNFRKKIRIGNTYYYLNKIIDWTNGQECKVELIRYTYYNLPFSIDTPTWKIFQSSGCQSTGGSTGGGSVGGGGIGIGAGNGNPLLLNLGGNLLTSNETYSDQTGDLDMGSTPYTNNSFPSNARGIIMGKNNIINGNDSFVQGDNNVVNDNNTVLIGSKNNTIYQKDVVLIGSYGNSLDVSGDFDFETTGTTVSGVTNLNTSVLINSNNNTITDSKIVLLNSSDNIIASGVTDVVLIGTTGVTVTENNKTYIGGQDLSTVVTEEFVYSVTGNTYTLAVTDSQSYTDLKSGSTETWVSDNYTSNTGSNFKYANKTTETYNTQNEYILADTYNGTGRTITLMDADIATGKLIIIHDAVGNANVNNITIQSETANINGIGTPKTISTAWGMRFIYSDGSNWFTAN